MGSSLREEQYQQPVRIDQLERHVLAAQVDVRHEPHQFGILCEGDLAGAFQLAAPAGRRKFPFSTRMSLTFFFINPSSQVIRF